MGEITDVSGSSTYTPIHDEVDLDTSEESSVPVTTNDEPVSDEDTLDPNYVGPKKEFVQEYSIAQEADPQRAKPGGEGIYLDREERKRAEIYRAEREGREPDLDNPPPIAGTPTYPTADLKGRYPGDYEIPVAGTQTVIVGTDDSTEVAPEDLVAYQENGGELSDKHDDAVLEKHQV
jgi:hypothetical protein